MLLSVTFAICTHVYSTGKKEKYRLVTGRYAIDVISSGRLASEIVWQKKSQQHATDQDKNGDYFIRTNMNKVRETMLWDIYNTLVALLKKSDR